MAYVICKKEQTNTFFAFRSYKISLKMNFFIVSAVLLVASNSILSSAQQSIPSCIQKRIDGILAGPVWNPPTTIMKYSYNDKMTFLFSSSCCDQFNYLYDALCNPICAPSGGFIGQGDGKCKDFFKNAKFLGKVWVDTRSRGK